MAQFREFIFLHKWRDKLCFRILYGAVMIWSILRHYCVFRNARKRKNPDITINLMKSGMVARKPYPFLSTTYNNNWNSNNPSFENFTIDSGWESCSFHRARYLLLTGIRLGTPINDYNKEKKIQMLVWLIGEHGCDVITPKTSRRLVMVVGCIVVIGSMQSFCLGCIFACCARFQWSNAQNCDRAFSIMINC